MGSSRGVFAALLFPLVSLLLAAGADAATLDAAGGGFTYTAANAVANTLVVSAFAGSYVIDDGAEAGISLGAGAMAAGCVAVDANTVSCPKSAVGSWNVQLLDQNDTASLAAVIEPTTI